MIECVFVCLYCAPVLLLVCVSFCVLYVCVFLCVLLKLDWWACVCLGFSECVFVCVYVNVCLCDIWVIESESV